MYPCPAINYKKPGQTYTRSNFWSRLRVQILGTDDCSTGSDDGFMSPPDNNHFNIPQLPTPKLQELALADDAQAAIITLHKCSNPPALSKDAVQTNAAVLNSTERQQVMN